jgi:protein-disulfide isomerase-like protein with CxxC motif
LGMAAPPSPPAAWLATAAASASAAAEVTSVDLLHLIQHDRYEEALDLVKRGHRVDMVAVLDKTYKGIRNQLRGNHSLLSEAVA